MPPRGRAGFAGAAVSSSAGGIGTHGLELMRLARKREALVRGADQWRGRFPQAPSNHNRAIWPAGVEPAVSGAQSRRGSHAPLRPEDESGRRDLLPSIGAARCSERFPMPSVARRHACQPPSWTARGMPCPLSDAGCTLRPTHRLSVGRCCVTPLGHPSMAQSSKAPPAGLEPAASGLRVRRHLPFDHGGVQLRRQGSNLRLAINSRASYRSTTPERQRKEREARSARPRSGPVEGVWGNREVPPAPSSRFFEAGYRAGGSPSKGDSGRLRTCTSPIKSRELCLLSYGAKSVAGRHRTCAPRVSGGRSTVLSYGHEYGRGWIRIRLRPEAR